MKSLSISSPLRGFLSLGLCSLLLGSAPGLANESSSYRSDSLPFDSMDVSKQPGNQLYTQAMSMYRNASTPRDQVFSYFKQAADKGSCPANAYTGQMLMQGDGVQRDYTLALDYYKKGVNCKDVQSIYLYGYCFENGIGTQVNLENARNLYDSASRKGFAPAMYSLAMMMLSDDPGNADAYDLIEQASKQRYKPAVDYYYKNIYEGQ